MPRREFELATNDIGTGRVDRDMGRRSGRVGDLDAASDGSAGLEAIDEVGAVETGHRRGTGRVNETNGDAPCSGLGRIGA